MKRIHRLSMITVLIALLCGCSEVSTTGTGGSSETVNAQIITTDTTVWAEIHTDTGAEVLLQLFSMNYHPFERTGATVSAAVHQNGTIAATVPSQGTYNMLLASNERNIACFVSGLSLVKGYRDTIECQLTDVATICGELVAAASSQLENQYVVSIYGSPFYTLADPLTGFSLMAIPSGGYTLSVRSTQKRLFIGTSNYTFTTPDNETSTKLRIVIP